jgi:hypothetical protein
LWKKALGLTVCTSSGKLYKPLGKCHTNIDNNWKYCFSTTDNYIYSTNNGKWIRHTPKRLAITQKFQLQGYSSDPPHLPFPAIPKVSQKAYICHHCSSSRQMQQANDKTQTHNFTEYLKADKILKSEQYIFQTPVQDWKEKNTSQLEDWITKYKPIISKSLRLAKKHTKQNTQDLRKFYTSTAKLPVTPALT